jgi:FkbM family methyltransferase
MSDFEHRGCWTGKRPLLLYGAGNAGRTVARFLNSSGVEIAAFLDAGARPGDIREGLPTFTLANWLQTGDPAAADILISLHSAHVDVAEIAAQLRNAGFANVLTMFDYVERFRNDPENRYWLVPAAFYDGKESQIAAARALLADDTSRVWFDGTMQLRRHGAFKALPPARPREHYIPADLPRWPEPMRLIDCGAFDGDTLQMLIGNGYHIGAAAAFEPDLANYTKLAQRFIDIDAIFLPCGVAAETGLVRFDPGQHMASRIDENGGAAIQCVTIDEVLPAFAPTLIKMDIEGAEPAALRGAERTIRRHCPALAISLYHLPEHLWELPLWVAALDLGYKFYMRGHGHNGFELVLYCRVD